MKQKFSKLEALRGFAAVYVVLHHTLFAKDAAPVLIFGQNLSLLFCFGQEAVILFFFLSGFVIQYSFSKSNDQSFKTFFLKRVLRIYIPLFLVFIADYLLDCQSKNQFLSIDGFTLTGNLLMLQDDAVSHKPNIICSTFLRNLPLWSLAYEWWFYMLFIFLVKQAGNNLSLKVYCIGIISAVIYLFYPNFLNRELMYLIIWWVGVDMAKLYVEGKPLSLVTLKLPLIAILICVVILFFNTRLHKSNLSIGYSPFLELRHFSFALVAIFIALLWKKVKWIGFKYSVGLFEPIASISFGIYISHWFLIKNNHLLDGLINNRFILFFFYFSICLLFSYFIERIVYVRMNKYILSKLTRR